MKNYNIEKEIVLTARDMLSFKIPLLEGCRRITSFGWDADEPECKELLTFYGVDSETDHFPIGKVRELCDPDYLIKVDKEIEEYLSSERESILKACRNIIQKYESLL